MNDKLVLSPCDSEEPGDEAERRQIADDYAVEVRRLIGSGGWTELPGPEDELPDEWLPNEFFDYWGLRRP